MLLAPIGCNPQYKPFNGLYFESKRGVDLIAAFVCVWIYTEPLQNKSSPPKCGVDILHTANDAEEKELA